MNTKISPALLTSVVSRYWLHGVLLIAALTAVAWFVSGYYQGKVRQLDGQIREARVASQKAISDAAVASGEAEAARLNAERVRERAEREKARLGREIAASRDREAGLLAQIQAGELTARGDVASLPSKSDLDLAGDIQIRALTVYPTKRDVQVTPKNGRFVLNRTGAEIFGESLIDSEWMRLRLGLETKRVNELYGVIEKKDEFIAQAELVCGSLKNQMLTLSVALVKEGDARSSITRERDLYKDEVKALKRANFWQKAKVPGVVVAGFVVGYAAARALK